jgi:colanic acid/amylovoran biosynthesis protein
MSERADDGSCIVMGASLDTGNLGVSALMAGTVKGLRSVHPGAPICLLEWTASPMRDRLHLSDGEVRFGCLGIRRNKAVWRRHHILRLLAAAAFIRLLPIPSWRRRLLLADPILKAIARARYVGDITGGDSFSDIYGLPRLLSGSLSKWLVLLAGADLVLLPQTYGPFRSLPARMVARSVFRRASRVYSRDRESLGAIASLLDGRKMRAVPSFSPDVAFLLDPIPPKVSRTRPVPIEDLGRTELIGFNVSGLLWNGGYTRSNMFGLRDEYRSVARSLAEALLDLPGTSLLLVPHVFVPPGDVESDADAASALLDSLPPASRGRAAVLEGEYDQSEIKHVIGRCRFFIGSRMHACIAAASQEIPVVPLAYSDKFRGVFESLGIAGSVVDLRAAGAAEVVSRCLEAFRDREATAARLREILPGIRERVLDVFRPEPMAPAAATSGADGRFEP